MKRFLGFIVIIALLVGGVGFYQGWFNYSSEDGLTVNQTKIDQDVGKMKDAGSKMASGAKDAMAKGIEKTKEFANAAAGKGKEWANAAATKTKEAWSSLSDKAKGAFDKLKTKLGKDETAFVASVDAIDHEAGTITVKLPDGETVVYELAKDAEVNVESGAAGSAVSTFADLGPVGDAAIAVDADGKVVKVFGAK
ncbi:MAG: hypothetical protein AAF628_12775 [Planctomycetota bacterium]